MTTQHQHYDLCPYPIIEALAEVWTQIYITGDVHKCDGEVFIKQAGVGLLKRIKRWTQGKRLFCPVCLG